MRTEFQEFDLSPFSNEPAVAFLSHGEINAMRDALARVEGALGRSYASFPGGSETGRQLVSVNPAQPSQSVGIHFEADAAAVEAAIRSASGHFQTWQFVPIEKRAWILLRAAELLRERKLEFAAWLVFEVGKNWTEADAEVAEAIDFLEFYARDALRLRRSNTPIQLPGERDELLHVPLGVVAVIPPWNFPLAILAGMTCAAIVAGNTVVLKPSPEAPTIAALFGDLLRESGLPEGVLNLCQGGAEVGKALVEHPDVTLVAFTGSMKVGLSIHAQVAQVRPGQRWIKRSVLELGGKDAIIVDCDANLHSAAAGVAASAFGFSGQKCSSCSRVIVDASIHDRFLAKLLKVVGELKHGAPRENWPIAPLINRAAYDRVLGYLEIAKQEGTIVTGGSALTTPKNGYFVAPTVVDGVLPNARIAQEEIFGPVLAVILANGFEDALRIANDTDYGLTGSVYSESAKKLEMARLKFHVGNLYFNRKCTGAIVGAHPFGGFKLSGINSKAGGVGYLNLFTQAKSVAELVA